MLLLHAGHQGWCLPEQLEVALGRRQGEELGLPLLLAPEELLGDTTQEALKQEVGVGETIERRKGHHRRLDLLERTYEEGRWVPRGRSGVSAGEPAFGVEGLGEEPAFDAEQVELDEAAVEEEDVGGRLARAHQVGTGGPHARLTPREQCSHLGPIRFGFAREFHHVRKDRTLTLIHLDAHLSEDKAHALRWRQHAAMTTPYHGRDLLGRLRELPPFSTSTPPRPRFSELPKPMSPEAFARWLAASTPDAVHERIERLFARARELAADGVADRPPAPGTWTRHAILAWHHAEDMEVLMSALGQPKALAGVHDLTETAPGKRIKEQLVRDEPWFVAAGLHRVDDWYRRWAMSLEDEEEVVIGYFNPHLAASFHNRGLDPSGPANASQAHLLSDHHFGHPEAPMDVVEQAVNFITHQLPREHMGVHHQPLGEWHQLSSVLERDPQAKASDLLRSLVADIAPLYAALEAEGHLVPWSCLRLSP